MSFFHRAVIGAQFGGLLLLVANSFAFGAVEPVKEPARPVGTWKWMKRIDGGKEEPAPPITWIITADGGSQQSGNARAELNIKFDSTSKPPAFDYNDGKFTRFGIWELKENTLRLCMPDNRREATRPASFTDEKIRTEIWVFERVAEAAPKK